MKIEKQIRNHNRGGTTAYCIGNGQLHDAMQMEKETCKTLNCMVDPMKILLINEDNDVRDDWDDTRPSDTETK